MRQKEKGRKVTLLLVVTWQKYIVQYYTCTILYMYNIIHVQYCTCTILYMYNTIFVNVEGNNCINVIATKLCATIAINMLLFSLLGSLSRVDIY